MTRTLNISVQRTSLSDPITQDIVEDSISILNEVFNSDVFKDKLISKDRFYCSNKSILCNENGFISGVDVYNDLMKQSEIKLELVVKPLTNPWRRIVAKTYGYTDIHTNVINTYTWWLKGNRNEILKDYSIHIGHELFHTKSLGYIHDPSYSSNDFNEEMDVTYSIDKIIEEVIDANFGLY